MSTEPVKITYKSKIDLWLVLFLAAAFGWPLYMTISEQNWVGLAVCLPVLLFLGYSVSTIEYRIKEDSLIIRSGFSRFNPIPVKTIRRIRETNSVLASPAASLSRLEIIYNRYDSVLISPKDKSGFIDEIKKINPAVEIVLKAK